MILCTIMMASSLRRFLRVVTAFLLIWTPCSAHISTTTSTTTNTNNNVDISMGTTLVAVAYRDGVVVGADTRTSVGGGYVSNRYAHKWNLILWNNDKSDATTIMVGRSGSAADTQRLCELVQWQLQKRRHSTTTTRQVAHCLRHELLQYGNNNNNHHNGGGRGEVSASLLCVGCDKQQRHDDITSSSKSSSTSVGRIYSIAPSGAILRESNFAVSGSGSTYVLGHLDAAFAKRTTSSSSDALLEEEQAIELVVQAIRLAMNRDGGSGGLVRIHVLNGNNNNRRRRRRSMDVYPESNRPSHQVEQQQQDTMSGGSSSPREPFLPGFAPTIRSAST